MEEGCSAWDRVRIDDGSAMSGRVGRPTAVRVLRMQRRIEALEAYLKRTASADATERSAAGVELLAELSLRAVYWGQVIYAPRSVGGPVVSRSDSLLTRFTVLLGLCAIVIVFLTILSLSMLLSSRGYLVVMGGIIVLGIVARAVKRRPRLERICNALRERRCPDCSYAMKDLDPGVDPVEVGGMWVGPARCPECGAAWPYIPPPVPERDRAYAEELLRRRGKILGTNC